MRQCPVSGSCVRRNSGPKGGQMSGRPNVWPFLDVQMCRWPNVLHSWCCVLFVGTRICNICDIN